LAPPLGAPTWSRARRMQAAGRRCSLACLFLEMWNDPCEMWGMFLMEATFLGVIYLSGLPTPSMPPRPGPRPRPRSAGLCLECDLHLLFLVTPLPQGEALENKHWGR
jgi:hypothetical protein